MKIVVALGGNALLRRGEHVSTAAQRDNVAAAVAAVARLAGDHELVITHGNGPQVGVLSLQAPDDPLDVLDAETEGLIGYLLEQELGNVLTDRPIATLLTQVIVDPLDPAFGSPTKPIGPAYPREQALRLASSCGWTVAPDGPYYRRVVSSPEPLAIVEIEAIRTLVEHGVLVICVGGGGIPVRVDERGALHGVEAVIDKDLAAALLATLLEADLLLMLTDVPAVERDWGTAVAAPIRCATAKELRPLEFAPGSMAPKIEAACRFAEATGGRAAIGALEDAEAIVLGQAGTTVTALPVAPLLYDAAATPC
jgi:carbamate kinase